MTDPMRKRQPPDTGSETTTYRRCSTRTTRRKVTLPMQAGTPARRARRPLHPRCVRAVTGLLSHETVGWCHPFSR
eukprot:4308393-Prymnesium_polylepis.1